MVMEGQCVWHILLHGGAHFVYTASSICLDSPVITPRISTFLLLTRACAVSYFVILLALKRQSLFLDSPQSPHYPPPPSFHLSFSLRLEINNRLYLVYLLLQCKTSKAV